ncbi:hypothetical protein [Spirillospora sp. CA-128828]|uniref:hypothetical protein n=1 Tax=Spirillospora sp. CA-128828 TaxID=3240033 RepID=UPI003D8F3D2A
MAGAQGRADGSATDAELLASSPFDEDLDAELAARPQRRSLPGPTLYLAAGIVLVAGFLGGVQAQKWSSDGSRPSGAGGLAAGPEGGRARSGYGGAPGYGGAAPGFGGQPGGAMPGGGQGTAPGGGTGTVGTVTKVVGDALYLRTSSGKTVKVKTSGTTRVRITKDGELQDLGKGSTVVVRGSTGTDGTVTASAVTEGSAR